MDNVILSMPFLTDEVPMKVAIGLVTAYLKDIRIEKNGKRLVPRVLFEEEDNSRDKYECYAG